MDKNRVERWLARGMVVLLAVLVSLTGAEIIARLVLKNKPTELEGLLHGLLRAVQARAAGIKP